MSLIGADDLEMDAALMDAGCGCGQNRVGEDGRCSVHGREKRRKSWEVVMVEYVFFQQKTWWNIYYSGTGIGDLMIFKHGTLFWL